MTKSQIKVLAAIYSVTDCSNEVHDYAMLHHTQARIADAMPTLVLRADGVVLCDGDGGMVKPERCGPGYRLTLAGYEALTAHNQDEYPTHLRRFAGGGA